MKNLFRNIFLVSCLLLTVGAVEAQAQSATTKAPNASTTTVPQKKHAVSKPKLIKNTTVSSERRVEKTPPLPTIAEWEAKHKGTKINDYLADRKAKLADNPNDGRLKYTVSYIESIVNQNNINTIINQTKK